MSLYPEGLPGQILPVTSQDTYASYLSPLSVIGSGGGGGGVQSVTSGLNISTSGPATNPVVFMRTNLFNLSSISFGNTGQGQINNLSTINGAAYPPPSSGGTDLAVSTITFPVGEGQIANLSTVNGAAYPPATQVPGNISLSTLTVSTITSPFGSANYIYLDKTDAGEANGALVLEKFEGPSLLLGGRNIAFSLLSGEDQGKIICDSLSNMIINDGCKISDNGTQITLPVNQGQLVNISTINGAPYGTAASANPLFSTIQVSTITTPTNPAGSPATTQTINIVIGGMRIQGGVCYCTSASYTTVTWANAFGTVPIVLTGAVGLTQGSGTTATVSGAGENSGQFTVNAAASTGVYWLCIGAA